jgi:hypothetical protein
MDEPLRGYGWVGVEWDDFGNAATPSAGTHLFNKLAVENLLYEFRYLRFPLLGDKGEDGAKRFNSLGHPTITFAVFVRVIAPDKRTALVTVFVDLKLRDRIMHPRS